MSHDQGWRFGPYGLAGPQGPLWCGAEVVAVPPKALAVLWTLVGQAGQEGQVQKKCVSKNGRFSRHPQVPVNQNNIVSRTKFLRCTGKAYRYSGTTTHPPLAAAGFSRQPVKIPHVATACGTHGFTPTRSMNAGSGMPRRRRVTPHDSTPAQVQESSARLASGEVAVGSLPCLMGPA
jgi:hypothetical protein